MLASTVEAATSNTSPPGGPSEVQALAPTGLSPRYFVPTAVPGLMPLARFPFSSRWRRGLSLSAAPFAYGWGFGVAIAICREPIDSFVSPNPFEMAPEPTSVREALSETTNRPIKRRRLEKAY